MKREYHFNLEDRQLKNGLRLVTVETEDPIFSAQIGVKIGSMYEAEDEKGLSHFIEHMLFKGTKNRANCDINEDIEERGGNYTAYTTYSDTVYGITGLAEELEPSLDIISDILINPIFPRDEFKKEKSVIISEIRRGLDDLEHYSFLKLHELAFEKSYLKWDIAGSERLIKKYTLEKLVEFYNKYYLPNNSVLTVVSPYSHGKVEDMVEQYFGGWKKAGLDRPRVITEKNRAETKISKKSDIEQSTVTYLYTFYGLTRREEIALEILSYRLGESPNSLLFKILREEKGLTYDVYSDMHENENVKTLCIYTSLDVENLEEAKEDIDTLIEGLKSGEYIERRNIDIMKKVIKTAIASTLIDPESLATYILGQAVSERGLREFEEDLEMLSLIEPREVVAVANKVLNLPTVQMVKPNH